MTTGATGQLGLALPVQGELSGTWGDTVNNGITQYTNIAIAGTLTLTGDGAVTLANTTGDASASNITSTLTGAGTVTAQFAIVRVTGTLTVAKVVTGPSYSKTYTVVNAATGGIVTFKASGQTGVSIAVGETAFVYFNGTDYVKVVGTATAGAAGGSTTQVQYNNAGVLAGITGATTNGTALTLVAPNLGSPASVGTMPAFTLGGTIAGGGNQINNVIIGTSTPLAGSFTTVDASGAVTLSGGTANGVTYLNGSKVLTSGSALQFDGTNLGIGVSPASILHLKGADPIQYFEDSSGTASFCSIQNANGVLDLQADNNATVASSAIKFSVDSAEGMRLTSTGLGIGTSAPLFKLQSNGTVARKYVTAGTSGSPAEEAGFIYADDTSTPVAGMWFYNAFSSNSATQLSFKTRTSGGTVTEALRIDASQNVGIGTSSPNAKLDVVGGNMAVLSNTAATAATASTYALWVGNSATRDMTLGSDATYAYIQSWSGKPLYINSQGNNVLFGSGNVGIGTSSPVTSLDVRATNGATIIAGRTANTGTGSEFGYFASYAPNASGTDIIWSQIKSLVSTATAGSEANSIVFSSRTAGSFTEKMRLDSSGNLGLGVTPSAWKSGAKALQLGTTGYASLNEQANGSTSLNFNCYESAANTWTYYVTGVAPTRYTQLSGAHNWFTAASGTAGNAISFTQAMTLDASGRLGIGTTSPTVPLSVSAATATVSVKSTGAGSNAAVSIDTTGTDVASLLTLNINGSTTAYIGSGGATYPNLGGNNSLFLWNVANGPAVFATNNTERARIDSSGNLLVGTTSGYSGERMTVAYNGSTQRGIVVRDTASQNSNPMAFIYGSTLVGYIGITSSSTSYNTSSDYRLKNTVAPMTGALAKVALLKPCTYKWNTDGSDGEGFIAHELAEVVPQCVTGEKDAVDAEGNPQYQGIDTSFLVATLTAALQELNAKFDAYVASHP